MQKVSKDTPLAELTLRRYEKPYGLEGRELVKKFCLSVGLLQPGDSRDVVVDLFFVLLDARKSKVLLSCDEIVKKVVSARKAANLREFGIAPSNIRRQLRRMKDLSIIEKVSTKYRIAEGLSLEDIVKDKIERFLLQSIMERVRDYAKVVDEAYQPEDKGF